MWGQSKALPITLQCIVGYGYHYSQCNMEVPHLSYIEIITLCYMGLALMLGLVLSVLKEYWVHETPLHNSFLSQTNTNDIKSILGTNKIGVRLIQKVVRIFQHLGAR